MEMVASYTLTPVLGEASIRNELRACRGKSNFSKSTSGFETSFFFCKTEPRPEITERREVQK